MYKIFGREPALVLAFIAALVQLASAFWFDLSGDQQGYLNGAVAALVGLATAWSVARDRLAPAVLGAAQALLALAVAFGLSWSAEQQSVIMAFVATAVAMFVRTQVTAPVAPEAVSR